MTDLMAAQAIKAGSAGNYAGRKNSGNTKSS